MRTLNRPMFKMGGPIKEGVMHGIREPRQGYAFGKEVVKQVGTKVPSIGAHYNRGIANLGKLWNWIKGKTGTIAQHQPITQVTKQPVTKWSQGYHGTVPGGTTFQASGPVQKVWTPSGWVARDPIYQIGRKAYEGRGWLGKPLKWAGKTIATPTGGLGLIYVGGQWLKSDGTPATDAEVNAEFNFKGGKKPGRGDEGMTYTDPEKAKKLAAQKRDERINNLLETMGYDKARKTAVGDALIDASRIITERGTLDKKNIGRELINPIIEATSKRLDKPAQLNEAVRLMMTKAEIEKEMNPLKDEALRVQIAAGKKTLAGGTLQEAVLEQTLKQGAPTGATLSQIARAKGVDNKVLPIKIPKNQDTLEVATEVITDTWKNAATEPDKVVKPGFYVVKDRIILVEQDRSIKPYL